MAKTKSSPPKKGKKSTKVKAKEVTAEPVPLRRSPRKAVHSTRKEDAEPVSAIGRVVKKVLPKKRSSGTQKATTDTARRVQDATTQATLAKSRVSKKSTIASAKETPNSATPGKRGRPRKDTTSNNPASTTPKIRRIVKSAKTSEQDVGSGAKVKAPTTKDEWTDSPKKKSPSKRDTKSPSLIRLSSIHADTDDTKTRQASIGGIRKSIEASNLNKAKRGRPKGRAPSVGVDARVRSASVKSAFGSPRGRSKSPLRDIGQSSVKSTAPFPSPKVAKTRSSASPSKRQPPIPARSRQASPGKPASDLGSTRVASRSPPKLSRSPSGITSTNIPPLERHAASDTSSKTSSRTRNNVHEDKKQGHGPRDRNRSVSNSRIDRTTKSRSDVGGVLDEDELAGPAKVAKGSPAKRKASTSLDSPRKKLSKSQSPGSRQTSVVSEDNTPLPEGQASAPGRGTVHSVTNPEFINGGKKKNPFFETMPAPEVWHRYMPKYLPFGETPYMQQVMSQQINDDLARGKEEKSQVPAGISDFVKKSVIAGRELLFGKQEQKSRPTASPWELPHVEQSEVEKVLRNIMQGRRAGAENSSGTQMGAPSQHPSPPKRVRRRSWASPERK